MSNINDLTVEQLKAELKKKGCRGYSKNNKAELVKLLEKCNTARRIHKTLLEKSRPTHVKKKSSPPAKKKSSPGKNPSAAGAAGKNPSARALSAGAGDYGSPYPRDGAAGKKPSAGDMPAATAGDVFDNSYLMTEISNYLPNNDLGNTLKTRKNMKQNVYNINERKQKSIAKRNRVKAFAERWRSKALDIPPMPMLRRQRGIIFDNVRNHPDYQTLIHCRRCNADIEGELNIYDIAERLRYNEINGLATVPIFICYRCALDLSLQTGFIRRN
jgi:hypothetical protein